MGRAQGGQNTDPSATRRSVDSEASHPRRDDIAAAQDTATNFSTPQDIDTELARLYYEAQQLRQRRLTELHRLLRVAGARYYYRGRQRVTDMTEADAMLKLQDRMDERDLSQRCTPREVVQELHAADRSIADNKRAADALERSYNGWPRFFLVTSSSGHVHSSMHCSTCRPSTTYGWLPNLSGKTESEAVEECGPTLCSVCFSTAPTDWQGGQLSKRQADDILAGRKVKAEPAKTYCVGSGEPVERPSHRYNGIYGFCPVCHEHVSGGKSGLARKHKPPKQ